MKKQHITDDGPKTCEAKTPETCRVKRADGSPVQHFDNPQEAQGAWEQELQEKYGVTSTVSKRTPSPAHEHSGDTKQVQGNSSPEGGTPNALGIHYAPAGDTHDGFYAHTTVRGVINPQELNNKSYREFGFEAPPTSTPFSERSARKYAEAIDNMEPITYALSREETASLSTTEKRALTYFTSEAHEWLNDYLYDPARLQNLEKDSPSLREEAAQRIQHGEHGFSFAEEEVNQSVVRELTSTMDEALTRGPGRQRIVYRGPNPRELGSPQMPPQHVIDRWARKNRALGTEVVFDGYTSATANTGAATDFSRGIVYEILTPQGVAISSISDEDLEDEVLLPRKQRYRVVGFHQNAKLDYSQRGTLIQMVAINSRGEILDGTNADPIDPVEVEAQ